MIYCNESDGGNGNQPHVLSLKGKKLSRQEKSLQAGEPLTCSLEKDVSVGGHQGYFYSITLVVVVPYPSACGEVRDLWCGGMP